MSFFKTKEQKVIEKMKVKKKEIDKLKEEMDKMAKLVLKDGKLQKIEDTPKMEQQVNEPDGFGPPLPPQAPRMPMPPQYPTQAPRMPMPPQYPTQDEVNVLRQRMIQREQQMQQQMQQQQQMYQQPVQQPMYRQPVQEPVETVILTIEMVNGAVFKYNIISTALAELTAGLNEAINNQTVFPLNERIINTKQIVSYYIE